MIIAFVTNGLFRTANGRKAAQTTLRSKRIETEYDIDESNSQANSLLGDLLILFHYFTVSFLHLSSLVLFSVRNGRQLLCCHCQFRLITAY